MATNDDMSAAEAVPAYAIELRTDAHLTLIWPGGKEPPRQPHGTTRNIDRVQVLKSSLTPRGFEITLRVLAWHDGPPEEQQTTLLIQ